MNAMREVFITRLVQPGKINDARRRRGLRCPRRDQRVAHCELGRSCALCLRLAQDAEVRNDAPALMDGRPMGESAVARPVVFPWLQFAPIERPRGRPG